VQYQLASVKQLFLFYQLVKKLSSMQSEWYYVIGAVAGFLPVSMGLVYLISLLQSPKVNYKGKHVQLLHVIFLLQNFILLLGRCNRR
jgi:hypothetical protein